jgi:hypothetical protein
MFLKIAIQILQNVPMLKKKREMKYIQSSFQNPHFKIY